MKKLAKLNFSIELETAEELLSVVELASEILKEGLKEYIEDKKEEK